MSNNQSNRQVMQLETLEGRCVPALMMFGSDGFIGPPVQVGHPPFQMPADDVPMTVEATIALGRPDFDVDLTTISDQDAFARNNIKPSKSVDTVFATQDWSWGFVDISHAKPAPIKFEWKVEPATVKPVAESEGTGTMNAVGQDNSGKPFGKGVSAIKIQPAPINTHIKPIGKS